MLGNHLLPRRGRLENWSQTSLPLAARLEWTFGALGRGETAQNSCLFPNFPQNYSATPPSAAGTRSGAGRGRHPPVPKTRLGLLQPGKAPGIPSGMDLPPWEPTSWENQDSGKVSESPKLVCALLGLGESCFLCPWNSWGGIPVPWRAVSMERPWNPVSASGTGSTSGELDRPWIHFSYSTSIGQRSRIWDTGRKVLHWGEGMEEGISPGGHFHGSCTQLGRGAGGENIRRSLQLINIVVIVVQLLFYNISISIISIVITVLYYIIVIIVLC